MDKPPAIIWKLTYRWPSGVDQRSYFFPQWTRPFAAALMHCIAMGLPEGYPHATEVEIERGWE